MIFIHYLFLGIFLFYYLAQPIVYPIINDILKNNYTHSHFGRLYSYAATTQKIVIIVDFLI